MKTVKNLFYIFLLLFTANRICFGTNDELQERTKSFSVNKGGKLYVNVNPGDIKITPWDKNEVVVNIRDLAEDEVQNVKMEKRGGDVILEYESEWGDEGAEFNITVPNQYNLELISSAGEIIVRGNMIGEVLAKTSGGDITLRNVNGNVTLNTAGGEIRVGDIDGSLYVSTAGGDINIGIVKGKSIKAVTAGGEIRIEKAFYGVYLKTAGGDISAGDLGGDSELFTSGGDITVGNVAGGIRIETSGGDLHLKGANGKVTAKTSGGNITLQNVIGSVIAKTSAGDISVMLDPAPKTESVISTSSGEIKLFIPPSAKTEIEARANYHGRWRSSEEEYKIYSDFPSKSYNNDEDSNEIKAVYLINGGGSKISLRTTDSDIKIYKSKNK